MNKVDTFAQWWNKQTDRDQFLYHSPFDKILKPKSQDNLDNRMDKRYDIFKMYSDYYKHALSQLTVEQTLQFSQVMNSNPILPMGYELSKKEKQERPPRPVRNEHGRFDQDGYKHHIIEELIEIGLLEYFENKGLGIDTVIASKNGILFGLNHP